MTLPTSIIVTWWVALVLFIYLLWKKYWRVQLHFNSTSLALYTPDTFPLREENEQIYDERIVMGRTHASQSTVVICGMLRDASSNLKNIQLRVEKLGATFKDYRVLIVENDSADDTRPLLLKWVKENPRVTVLGCGVNMCEDEGCHLSLPKTEGHGVDRRRIDKMIYLRNIYLDYVRTHYPSMDYTIVWDLDIIGSVYLDGVHNSMGYLSPSIDPRRETSVMTANGMYRWGLLTLYYDTYALLQHGEGFDINYKTASDVRKGLGFRYIRGQAPVEVQSAFGGFAIYRTSALLSPNVNYEQSPSDGENIMCEHTNLCKKMVGKVYVNPSMIHYVLLNL